MKTLITGSGGFVGKRLLERLLEHGQTDIRCMLRDTSKSAALQAIAAKYPAAHVEMFAANLKSQAEIAAAINGVGLIIHAAAAMKGSASEMFLDSVVASRNLLDAVVALEASQRPRIVLISSFGVLGVASLERGAIVRENTPLETHPEQRDIYSYAKLRQEQMFWDYQQRYGLDLVVLRPGVIYGPGGGHFSTRIGLSMFGRFVHLGGNNLIPLTFVENCAEAVVLAALSAQASGQVYNVVDDDLLTSRQYLQLYRRQVKPLKAISIPYWLLLWGSSKVERYNQKSRGQLPAIFTPYKTRATWGGNRFTNEKLKSLGWKQVVSTQEGLRRTFEAFQAEPAKAP
jgi:nucleoside-diphosphate-sugar epimerase